MSQSSNPKYILAIWLAIIAVIVFGSFQLFKKFQENDNNVVCPTEAKICSDGSTVARSGPQCQFAKCPGEDENQWIISNDKSTGISFKYPENLPTKYISAFDWPPKIQITLGPFSCLTAGTETSRSGRTELKSINGQNFCITTLTEGAAGSIYTQYAYAFPKDNKVPIITFSLRSAQCGNYDPTQRTQCESERSNFNIDSIVSQIANTLTMSTTTLNISTGYISGNVYLGPICPVVSSPPDPKCADKPYETKLILTSSDGSLLLKEFASDKDGKFSIEVKPGEYAIRSATAANVFPYCSTNDSVKVRSSTFVETTVYCDTGIR